jgi:hypothetical protein
MGMRAPLERFKVHGSMFKVKPELATLKRAGCRRYFPLRHPGADCRNPDYKGVNAGIVGRNRGSK